MNERQTIHRMECLEAEIRMFRQALRNISKAILAGQDNIKPLAEAALALLDNGKKPRSSTR